MAIKITGLSAEQLEGVKFAMGKYNAALTPVQNDKGETVSPHPDAINDPEAYAAKRCESVFDSYVAQMKAAYVAQEMADPAAVEAIVAKRKAMQ